MYIRRKGKMYLAGGEHVLPGDYILNMLANIESLGYTLSAELIGVVETLPEKQFKSFYNQLVSDLKENAGAHKVFAPMYPNFPDQVKKASDRELYTNAFLHYIGDFIGQRIMPVYEKLKREPLKDEVRLKVIGLGSKEDFNAIFTRLLSAKTSVSETDKKDIEWFIKTYNARVIALAPDEIPLKENVAFYIGCLLKNNIEGAEEALRTHAKTATDILRLAVALSGGDISLAENTKFTAISKKNRKLLLSALEAMGNITEDMLRYKNRWKRLGEKLHPGEYRQRFPLCAEAFNVIRNDLPFETFNSKVEKNILGKNLPALLGLLTARPGECARRLDLLIRMTNDPAPVLAAFSAVAGKVSSPVLLQVMAHFKHRNEARELRTFFPKGDVGKARSIGYNLPVIDQEICSKVVSVCEEALVARFSTYPPLGKVYIHDLLKNYTVPFAMRSASKALKTISRGSKIHLPMGNTIRFFIYWKDGKGRTDLDLSALALDEQSFHKTTIAYYNLKDMGGYHSGDITSAPGGASEFIDIDIAAFLKQGIRYVLMSVNSFTSQPYCDLPDCFAGVMMRQYPDSGEIYDPKTVENKFDLTANSRIAIPLIIDLQERKLTWVDLSLKNIPDYANNVHNNLSSLTIINKAMTMLVKPNLYELFTLHARARGEITTDANQANTIFAVHNGIKPVDIDIIVSEFL